ncbi:response regulator transcription factor [Aliiglaciecola lipolytica]|uniref:Two-component system, OmpR family, response regulator CpxR n=1 Tax=Aliiglaciecola lipolytica E3 TaxID=1127673 RepID=K6XWN9_9ALTE|nr:response regulator transcription factor [Aliiglaciecola lipolytica]GAC16081.1 two-component system, OmpR family, response regulator CpxR [Aliiglaciecola lipolytica E3]
MQTKSLLIIDDDIELCNLLVEYLAPQGYDIDLANDGETGLQKAIGQKHYDLILLDVMLPEIDGFEVLKRLRTSHLTPVLMLTAKGDDFDKIFGLELGADDYLPKPFNHRELSARIKAIVRRMDYLPSSSSQQRLQIENVALNPNTQSVECSGKALDLTATEFLILHLLMINAGQIVSKNDISEKVLGRKLMAFDRSIDMHVSNIRRKLMQHSKDEKIKTVRGTGYLYVVES